MPTFATAPLQVSRQAVYIGGYYTKEARGMCQSPWLVDGGGTSVRAHPQLSPQHIHTCAAAISEPRVRA